MTITTTKCQHAVAGHQKPPVHWEPQHPPEPQPAQFSWTSFSLFHKPAQQHKYDPERDRPHQTQGICFVLRLAAKKVTETKTAHKKTYPVEHFKWPQMYAGLPWTFLGSGMHMLMLRDSGCPTSPWLRLQGWGYTAPAPPICVLWLPCPLLGWLWADLCACLKCGSWALWDKMILHIINWTALINFFYHGGSSSGF